MQGNIAAWNGASTLSPTSGPIIIDTVFTQDLSTGEQKRVAKTVFKGGQIGQVRTDGRWIVWSDFEFFRIVAGNWRIYALDTRSNTQFEVARNTTPGETLAQLDFAWPTLALASARVVWDEGYAVQGRRAVRIQLRNLETKSAQVLVDSNEDGLLQPSISGARVAFVRVRGALTGASARPTITVVDITTGRESEPDRDRAGFQPWLYNDTLVWKGGELGAWGDVVLYDFRTDSTSVIARDDADLPSIGDRYVAWQGKEFDHVGLFDLSSGSLLRVPGGGRPIVQADTLAWLTVDQPDPNWRGSIRYVRS